jgi:hypothetical protein
LLRRLGDRRRQRPDGNWGAETLHGFVRLARVVALERIGGQRANADFSAGSSAVGRELRRAAHSERGHARWEGESDAPKGRLCDLSCASHTVEEERMKESYSEGVATHADPESCGGDREVAVEALDRGTCAPAIEPRN